MDLNQHPEWQKAQRGELYHAFVPELESARNRCAAACDAYNDNRDQSRRTVTRLWRAPSVFDDDRIINDPTPLPPQKPSPEEDANLFAGEPYVIAPIHADYGFNIAIAASAFVNFGSTFVDTCPIKIGARTLVGPNCSFYSGTHPIDPAIRNGILGPESGKPIVIGDDCWLGGGVTILPGITVGRGCSIGAGSVVTKDVPAFHVVAGNPARIIRKIKTSMDPQQSTTVVPADEHGREGTEALLAEQ